MIQNDTLNKTAETKKALPDERLTTDEAAAAAAPFDGALLTFSESEVYLEPLR
jgi:hypothetical protein